ncbi:hypothetical protein [Hymenobacter psoromatis]|uniref:hypothetical protein n=1 Tax=Hymenobacter psoromatis TaxID=1484116 RepID=UPI001CBC0F58|nr:hypothetical protein [Hymenobacter psoromatis]
MKNLLFLCACLWALAMPLRAVAGPPDIIVVQISLFAGDYNAIITRGKGKSETIALNNGGSKKDQIQCNEEYYQLFQQLYQEGYILQSTFTNRTADTTLLFVKASTDSTK